MPGGEDVISGLVVQHRYEGDIFSGEKRTDLLVVPALSVRVTPGIAMIPAAAIRSTPRIERHRSLPARTTAGRGQTAGRGRPGRRRRLHPGADALRQLRQGAPARRSRVRHRPVHLPIAKFASP